MPNVNAYFEVYDKVTYRPVQDLERDEDLLQNLDGYLEEVLGKKYSVSLSKFWRRSISLKNHEGKPIEDVNRTFQCAELVAKMYKVLGLLPDNQHTGAYCPVHFSEKKTIPLQKGRFGPECTILPNRS